jgi:hypothetical protein
MDSTAQSPTPGVPTPPAKRNLAALLLAPAGATVATVLVLLRLHFEPTGVPMYSVRPASPSVVAVHRGDAFALDLHPERPVVGAVAARGFLLQGESVHPWQAAFSVDVDGEVHITGDVDTLFAGVPDGRWEAAVAVGRPEMLPTAPRDVLRARAGTSPSTWHLAWEVVELQPRAP